MNASLNEKLRAVKWGEFKLGDLFEVVSYKKCFDANKVAIIENRGHPYIVRQSTENGRKGNIDEPIKYLNPGNTISFGQDTATMFYQEKPYFTGDKIKILRPKYAKFGKNNAQFFLSTMRKAFCSFAWGSSRFNVETLKKQMVSLPIKNNGYIDFDFMESFIAELEAERVAELSAYLTVSGLDNYELSSDEENALKNYQSLKWDTYNLEKLFGKSTRGKRLKGDDRIAGTLPFVTAGEASEGISAYISNEVEVFEKNTTTIDMFGSAKYRNYIYGGDDHNLRLVKPHKRRELLLMQKLPSCATRSSSSPAAWRTATRSTPPPARSSSMRRGWMTDVIMESMRRRCTCRTE